MITTTGPPIVLPASAVLFAPDEHTVGAGHRIVMQTDTGRVSQDLHQSLPVAETFPMLARHLASVVALGMRARATFWVEPVRRRR
jgi:hypothetical protein